MTDSRKDRAASRSGNRAEWGAGADSPGRLRETVSDRGGSSWPGLASRWPHRIALLLGFTAFPLIWMGGLVTTWDAGMAVPDWPNTYGYNMFAYPVYDWLAGPFDLKIEHGHRLLGSLAGIWSIVLLVVTWRTTADRTLRWYAVALLALVIVQGALGGVRVLRDSRTFAQVHGCVGPAFFAAVCGFAVLTGRWWQRRTGLSRPFVRGGLVHVVALAMLAGSFLQLVLGTLLRHMPEQGSPTSFALLVWLHVSGALCILAGTLLFLLASFWRRFRDTGLRGPLVLAGLLVLAQIGLGLATWVVKFGWPAWMERWEFAAAWTIPERTFLQSNLVTLHVVTGSLIVANWTVVAFRLWRVSRLAEPAWLGVASSGAPAAN